MGCPAEVNIGEPLVFSVCSHDPDTGVLTDAASAPSYRVYEDETATAILTGSMAKLDDANTTGFYTESIACTSANGFEDGKSYTIYIEATVDGDTGGICYGFKARDAVDRLGSLAMARIRFDPTVRGYWPLTESASTTSDHFQDQSSYAHHATLTGSASKDRGRLTLSGGYLEVAASDDLEFACTAETADVAVADTGGVYNNSATIVRSADDTDHWFVAYRKNPNDIHAFDADATVVIRKSEDDRVSFDDFPGEVTIFDFDAGYDARAPDLFLFDNDGTETLLCVATQTDVSSNFRAYWSKSTDGGVTWTAAALIAGAGDQRATKGRAILLSNGQIALALWNDTDDITYCYKVDKDIVTWAATTITTANGDETTMLELKTNGTYQGRVGALTRQNSPAKYHKTFSDDYGATWGTSVVELGLPFNTQGQTTPGTPASLLRTMDDVILAFYTAERAWSLEGTHTLSVYQSFDEMQTWSKLGDVHYDRSISTYPSVIEAARGEYALVWSSNGTTSQVFYDTLDAKCQVTETAIFTVAARFQRTSTAAWDTIVDLDPTNQYLLRFNDSGQAEFYFGGAEFNTGVIAHDLLPHTIVMTVTNRHIRCYADGVLFDVDKTPADLAATALSMGIGASHDGGGWKNHFPGPLEVMIQATCWTAEQVRSWHEHHFAANRFEETLERLGSFAGGSETVFGNTKRAIEQLENVYYADIYATIDDSNTQDEYTVQWYKNGVPVINNITSPTIQVVARADGTDLVASVALTQIGTTGAYRYDETTAANRLTPGESAVAYTAATIDGQVRRWRRVVGRDI